MAILGPSESRSFSFAIDQRSNELEMQKNLEIAPIHAEDYNSRVH